MVLKNGNKSGNGGKRTGAGRKPKAATIIRQRIIENKIAEANAAFSFLCAILNNPDEPSSLRLQASGMIMDRVWGKPKESVEHSGTVNPEYIDVVVHDGHGSDHASHP